MLSKPDHCLTCVGCNWPDKGYVPASGTGDNGVLVIAEAAGEDEAIEGMPLVGRAGYFLWQNLQRAGIEREGFRCHNVLSCRPPDNHLVKMPYEAEAIAHCSPLLDATIQEMQEKCRQNGRTFVILTLGKIALKRILGWTDKSPELKQDYLCYPFQARHYGAWVIPVDHPSYIMRGNNRLIPVMQFAFKRALEIAEHGLTLDIPQYVLDPAPDTFKQWVRNYLLEASQRPLDTFLSYDIETPYKKGKSEEALGNEEGDNTILRVSFSYRPDNAVSVPWRSEYMAGIEELFTSEGPKVGWNNSVYDDPRIMQYVPINGDRHDGMLAWHVLNSALDKSLGSVTPFYVPTTELWKHLSDKQPAFYNAKDADMALHCFLGIIRDLKANDLWRVYDHHIVRLNRALNYMSRKGVLRDEAARQAAEEQLSGLLTGVNEKIQTIVPNIAKKIKVYKKTPKDTTGMLHGTHMVEVKVCDSCGLLKPNRWKKHSILCNGKDGVFLSPVMVWEKPLEFKDSKVNLQRYQQVVGHKPILTRKERKVTFDEAALMRLMKWYPEDQLYPRLLEHREVQKLLSTYVGKTSLTGVILGGMPIGPDGRIHTIYQHNPSTLRLASQSPNLQNLPRPNPKDPNDLCNLIRNLVVAGPGQIFAARDYSGIEAVLVGYFAAAPRYIRLAKIDVHTFYTMHALHELDGRIRADELPDLSWPDDKLVAHLAHYKELLKAERNSLYKHLVHGANFAQMPPGAAEKIFKETGKLFPLKLVTKVMEIYHALFPEIRRWHRNLLEQVANTDHLRNPFGFVHRFFKPYKYEKIGPGKHDWDKKPGDDANAIIAFLPQSTARGIMTEALMRLYFERFDEAGQYLRLTTHDELLWECPPEALDKVDQVVVQEMEKPVPELAMPKSWGLGEHLVVLTEGKQGVRWGKMK